MPDTLRRADHLRGAEPAPRGQDIWPGRAAAPARCGLAERPPSAAAQLDIVSGQAKVNLKADPG